jgi:similar to spore coat protein
LDLNNKIAPHEAFELHELLTFKNVCATKSATLSAMVDDDKLKSLLEQDVTKSKEQISELENLMKQTSNYTMI